MGRQDPAWPCHEQPGSVGLRTSMWRQPGARNVSPELLSRLWRCWPGFLLQSDGATPGARARAMGMTEQEQSDASA